jgi:DNA-binding LytR/AlgR family response regulator
MQEVKVLIVDDEPLARELLEAYLSKIPGFKLIGKCSDALEAHAVLAKEACDLLLLDINMPEISGIDFLKTLKNPPKIIFTTAYSKYAVESYDLNAVDYLLKPITFDRFIKAIHKVTDLLPQELNNAPVNKALPQQDDIVFVKSNGKMVRIMLSELWFVEGLKNYINLWTNNGKIIVHSTMKNFEEQLEGLPSFIRINKSFIVNLKFISEIDGNCVRVKDQLLTIGNTYRNEVKHIFERYNLL